MRSIAFILLLLSFQCIAQLSGDWITSGPLKLRVNPDGQLANFNNSPSAELPAGSNNHLFKFINLWVSGYDAANQLHIATSNGYHDKTDYSPGPVDLLTFDGADPADWSYVWSVNSAQVNEHRKNFKNIGYSPSDAIKNWPANGSARFNKFLAPFIDYDQNGTYEPEKGDYPDIFGNENLYFITNDNYSEHKASGGQPLKIEVYGMLYSLSNLPGVVFAKYYIMNRTDKDITNLKVSLHSGFELGHDKDNYCGTLVTKNTIFSYNGDDNDENHYGKTQPIAAIIVLNRPLSSSLYVTNDQGTHTGMPGTPLECRNLMEGKWKSSKILTFGNDGLGNNAPTGFVYPGNTDPAFITENWKEDQAAGERSLLANISYPSLMSKAFIELDFAITGFEKSSGDPYLFLDAKADAIKSIWSNHILSAPSPQIKEGLALKNPISPGENFYLEGFGDFDEITVINQLGQTILKQNPKVEKELIIKEKGTYYLILKSDNQSITNKIIII